MGGVDLSDQMILYYGYAHRSKKWWKRAFFYPFITDANVLYNLMAPKKFTQFDFHLEIATGLLQGFHHRTQQHYIKEKKQKITDIVSVLVLQCLSMS